MFAFSYLSRKSLSISLALSGHLFFFFFVMPSSREERTFQLFDFTPTVCRFCPPWSRALGGVFPWGGTVPPLQTRILNALQQWEETPLAMLSFVRRINKPEKTMTNLLQPAQTGTADIWWWWSVLVDLCISVKFDAPRKVFLRNKEKVLDGTWPCSR